MARVHTMKSSRVAHTCEICKDAIPVGHGYRYFQVGFRSSYKHIRCMKASCSPRPSQLTNSKVSAILAAQESAHDELTAASVAVSEVDDIKAIMESVVEAINEVKDEYQEGLDNWPSGNASLEEKVETLDSAADTLDSWAPDMDDKPPACDEHEGEEPHDDCEACASAADLWWSDVIQDARDAIDAVELP